MRSFIILIVAICGGCAVDVEPTSEVVDGPGVTSAKADLVDVTGELAATLPTLFNPEIVSVPAAELGGAPGVELRFGYTSCAEREWTVKRERQQSPEGEVILLQLEDQHVDCFGPAIPREYEETISADGFLDHMFVVLNPSLLTYR